MTRNSRIIYSSMTVLILLFAVFNDGEVVAQQRSSQSLQGQCYAPLVNSMNEFGASLIKNIGEKGNLFISPFSIYAALSLVYLGARGRTAQEMERAFHLINNRFEISHFHESLRSLITSVTSKNDEYSLFLANGIFVQHNITIKDKYIDDAKKFYSAVVEKVDFAKNEKGAKNSINKFVAENTRNKITDFLTEPLDQRTILSLINAIYFKGIWNVTFPKKNTKEKNFYKADGPIKRVKFMFLLEKEFRFFQDSDSRYKFLELPYKGDHVSMLLALPESDEESPNLNMNSELLCKIDNELRKKKMAIISLPKFQLKYKKGLADILFKLGIRDLFSFSADLTGIRKEGGIEVSKVIHEAIIDVNEEGSEAVAATGVSLVRTMDQSDVFHADHPFLFYIVDTRNALILFSGRVSDP